MQKIKLLMIIILNVIIIGILSFIIYNKMYRCNIPYYERCYYEENGECVIYEMELKEGCHFE